MYQPLICRIHAGSELGSNHPRRLAALFDPQDMECLTHALVDGVRRNPHPEGDFLGRQMLVDQRQALSLPLAQARYAVVGRLSQNQVSNSNRKRSHSASPETERLQTVRY